MSFYTNLLYLPSCHSTFWVISNGQKSIYDCIDIDGRRNLPWLIWCPIRFSASEIQKVNIASTYHMLHNKNSLPWSNLMKKKKLRKVHSKGKFYHNHHITIPMYGVRNPWMKRFSSYELSQSVNGPKTWRWLMLCFVGCDASQNVIVPMTP